MKTPGVHIVEKNAFPNSVVQVATAIPAFIGHTERAGNGRTAPVRLTSLAEFHTLFGGPPVPLFRIEPWRDLPGPSPLSGEGAGVPPALPRTGFTAGTRHDLVRASVPYALHDAMQLFFLNGGGACHVVSTGGYDDPIEADRMIAAIEALRHEPEPTLLVIPETTRLSRRDAARVQRRMLGHCGTETGNRFAILDISGGHLPRSGPLGDPVATFREDIGGNDLGFGAAYYPWLATSLWTARDVTWQNIHPESRPLLIHLLGAGHDPATCHEIARIGAPADPTPETIDKALRALVPLYGDVTQAMADGLNAMPPGAAMAGLYAMVDNSRGVWAAPANVPVNATVAPMVHVDHDAQEDLNQPANGRSINAIRSFAGRGTLVWGARTLDGNTLDWRYVNVRRTAIMVGESIRLACRALGQAPNTATTWTTMKTMIENFLTSIWKAGGLAGSTPRDAFGVHIGLGETMTARDIAEGRVRVTVTLALVRPAEFVEISFEQPMPAP